MAEFERRCLAGESPPHMSLEVRFFRRAKAAKWSASSRWAATQTLTSTRINGFPWRRGEPPRSAGRPREGCRSREKSGEVGRRSIGIWAGPPKEGAKPRRPFPQESSNGGRKPPWLCGKEDQESKQWCACIKVYTKCIKMQFNRRRGREDED